MAGADSPARQACRSQPGIHPGEGSGRLAADAYAAGTGLRDSVLQDGLYDEHLASGDELAETIRQQFDLLARLLLPAI